MSRRETKRARLAVAGTVAVLLGLTAATDARTGAEPAPVGGPPTLDYDRCPDYLENGPCTDPIVLGGRRVFNGAVELVGYDSRTGTCVDVDHPAADIGAGFCGFPLRPEDSSPIDLVGWIHYSPGPEEFTDLVGTVSDPTARVGVRYRRDGEARRRNALIATVDEELAAEIGADEPFRVFAATLRGCIQVRTARPHGVRRVGQRDRDGSAPALLVVQLSGRAVAPR